MFGVQFGYVDNRVDLFPVFSHSSCNVLDFKGVKQAQESAYCSKDLTQLSFGKSLICWERIDDGVDLIDHFGDSGSG